jgi:hypothetical protein
MLIPWLAIAGLFRVIEVFPRSILIGQSDQKLLRRYLLWQVVTAGFLLAVGVRFIILSGVIGIAWSMAAIQIGRFLVSQVHYLRGSYRPTET